MQSMCLEYGYICTISSIKLHIADFTANGKGDLLLQRLDESSVVLVTGEDGAMVSSESLGLDIRSDKYTVEISDQNNDNRDDIKVFLGGRYIETLLAGEGGKFSSGENDNDLVTINATWTPFQSAILDNNRSNMESYIDSASLASYVNVFDALGHQVNEIAAQIGVQKPLYVSGDIAVFLIEKKTDDGTNSIHSVTYKRQSDGAWKVYQL